MSFLSLPRTAFNTLQLFIKCFALSRELIEREPEVCVLAFLKPEHV